MKILAVVGLLLLAGCGGGSSPPGVLDAFADTRGVYTGTWVFESLTSVPIVGGTAQLTLSTPTVNEPVIDGILQGTGRSWHIRDETPEVVITEGSTVMRLPKSGSSPLNIQFRAFPLPVKMESRSVRMGMNLTDLADGIMVFDLTKQ